MNYIEVSFIVLSPEDYLIDLLIQKLADKGFESFEETDLGFKAFVPSNFLNMVEAEKKVKEIGEEGFPKDLFRYEISLIPERNWNKEWESNFNPVSIGTELLIRAPFHTSSEKYKYTLTIEPKMAFGTGHHETTCLMAQFLLEETVENVRVLDMGCGTGILGILADKIGAKFTLAVDNDEVCTQSTLENSKINQSKNLIVLKGDIDKVLDRSSNPNSNFEIILANINRNILLEHLEGYSNLLSPEGSLFLSGFYEGRDLEMIQEKASELDLKFIIHKTLRGWCAAKFCK